METRFGSGNVVINNRVGNTVSFGKSAWEPL